MLPHTPGLLSSQQLPAFCQLILKIGNFLNYVSQLLTLTALTARPPRTLYPPSPPDALTELLSFSRAATRGMLTVSR